MKQVEGRDIYSISEVNYIAKQTLEQLIFWVEGEVSTLRKNPSWNFYYLDLKDEKSSLPCITEGHVLNEFGEDLVGQKILAYGNLSLYEPFGKYQFRISHIEKAGEGLMQRQLEELIRKLKTEGLFDPQHKIEIPIYPKRVCLVTSVGSDAYNDFIRHSTDKFPIIELFTADIRVQGPQSIPNLLKVLPQVDKEDFDVIVITRGGGSIEDLAAFNNEKVARAIFKMKTPTIVAIGHEANESLAEWVADVRASTPTDAANIVTFGYVNVMQRLENLRTQLSTKTSYYFSTNFQNLDYIFLQLQQTKLTFKDLPSKLALLKENLKRHEKHLISDAAQTLSSLEKSLFLLSPENTLSRGYSITTDERGGVIRNITSVVVGNTIGVKLTGGSLKSTVTEKTYD